MSLFPLFQDFTGYSLYKSSGQATDLGAQKNPSVTWQHKGQEVPQLVYTLLTCNLMDLIIVCLDGSSHPIKCTERPLVTGKAESHLN